MCAAQAGLFSASYQPTSTTAEMEVQTQMHHWRDDEGAAAVQLSGVGAGSSLRNYVASNATIWATLVVKEVKLAELVGSQRHRIGGELEARVAEFLTMPATDGERASSSSGDHGGSIGNRLHFQWMLTILGIVLGQKAKKVAFYVAGRGSKGGTVIARFYENVFISICVIFRGFIERNPDTTLEVGKGKERGSKWNEADADGYHCKCYGRVTKEDHSEKGTPDIVRINDH
ncbi:hypothetical protein TSMEX_000040 [Taenia solium]|eukprot:TsM_001056700 transcript=TsM_001056700 gene=TsM_001056700